MYVATFKAMPLHWPGSRHAQFLKQLPPLLLSSPDVQHQGKLKSQRQGHLRRKCFPLHIQRHFIVVGEIEATFPNGNQASSSSCC